MHPAAGSIEVVVQPETVDECLSLVVASHEQAHRRIPRGRHEEENRPSPQNPTASQQVHVESEQHVKDDRGPHHQQDGQALG